VTYPGVTVVIRRPIVAVIPVAPSVGSITVVIVPVWSKVEKGAVVAEVVGTVVIGPAVGPAVTSIVASTNVGPISGAGGQKEPCRQDNEKPCPAGKKKFACGPESADQREHLITRVITSKVWSVSRRVNRGLFRCDAVDMFGRREYFLRNRPFIKRKTDHRKE
jgi:hypothetical protein